MSEILKMVAWWSRLVWSGVERLNAAFFSTASTMQTTEAECKYCADKAKIYDMHCVRCNKRLLERSRSVNLRYHKQALEVIAKAAGSGMARAAEKPDPEAA